VFIFLPFCHFLLGLLSLVRSGYSGGGKNTPLAKSQQFQYPSRAILYHLLGRIFYSNRPPLIDPGEGFILIKMVLRTLLLTKLIDYPDELGNRSLPDPYKNYYLNRHLIIPSLFSFPFLFIKADGWFTKYHTDCHVFKLFLLIFLSWVGVVVQRRLTTSQREL